jgi:hypothetical protein
MYGLYTTFIGRYKTLSLPFSGKACDRLGRAHEANPAAADQFAISSERQFAVGKFPNISYGESNFVYFSNSLISSTLARVGSGRPCHQRPIARQQPAATERRDRIEFNERSIGRCRIGDGSGERNSHRMTQPEID